MNIWEKNCVETTQKNKNQTRHYIMLYKYITERIKKQFSTSYSFSFTYIRKEFLAEAKKNERKIKKPTNAM